MDKVRKRFLIVAAAGLLLGASAPRAIHFYPDDPLLKMPPPVPVPKPLSRSINQLYDFVINTASPPGEKHPAGRPIPAKDINTLGEVPDGLWYTNRHHVKRMSLDELRRGPSDANQPMLPFKVVGAKTEGITPGFQIEDARGRRYLAKPDPISNPEMATAADVVTSKFLYALGYNVPENYITYFTRGELAIDPKARITPVGGRERAMVPGDLDRILDIMPRDREGRYRMMASKFIEGKGIGPFRWTGTRDDDPNDIYKHEHRRALRGLHVFAAWVNHTDAKAGNTYDTLVEVNGVPAIRHYLIDFGASLGSDSDGPKNARFGHEYMIDRDRKVLLKMFSLGLYSPDWERADYPGIKAVGRFEAETFNPESWATNYPNPAFMNRLPDDTFWAARQVMVFTEPEVRAIVTTGQYSNPEAVDYLTRTIMQRRERIGREYFSKVLPLDGFAVRGGSLSFEDLGVKYGITPAGRNYRWEWFRFDNSTGQRSAIASATGPRVPDGGQYVEAKIQAAGDDANAVWVYLRDDTVVGIDRTW